LFVARWAFVQYGDENNAHERTLNALVAAVETKDARTRGHSERVAHLCDIIAGALGLNHTEIASLRYAGMLHDVGILGVPSRVLRKVDGLSGAERQWIRQHPTRGAEIVRDIQFLQPALNGIEHHHERFDGRGYPAGLAGDDIPLFARIVAVADAFESLTTTNADRGALPVLEALDEVERRGGTQFDPVVVAALRRGLSREPWVSRTLDLLALPGGGRGYDHDDPRQSDAMADVLRPAAGSGRSSAHIDRRAP
jgi:putative nucleotidyltransferase with HDIG domain